MYLGLGRPSNAQLKNADDFEQICAREEAEENEKFKFSLLSTCLRYAIQHQMAFDKKQMQESFLNHVDQPFSGQQIEYSAEDALVAAKLYLPQVNSAAQKGILQHLTQVEMPWSITNASMEWVGVRVDSEKIPILKNMCDQKTGELKSKLEDYGIKNSRSYKELRKFFLGKGLIQHFRRNGKITFDKKQLELKQDQHPAIKLIRDIRRLEDIKSDPIVSKDLAGADGRVHPQHKQLGASTGRQSCKWPNIQGLGSTLRPLVIPADGYGIGEVDWSQMEVGLAGAIYGDEHLVEMFNTGDVYSSMAQNFYRKSLTEEDLGLSSSDFKNRHPELRNKMKSCTLGIIYGMSSFGLAQKLNTNQGEAKALLERFMSMFPQLQNALEQTSTIGFIRRYGTTCNGLRRHLPSKAQVNNRPPNWLINFPVQGSAAVIFKVAGNRLDQLYQEYGAHLIIPLHDAFIFEAPMDALEDVATLTERVMCDVIKEFFPELRPKVEINISRPDCWNKGGNDLFSGGCWNEI